MKIPTLILLCICLLLAPATIHALKAPPAPLGDGASNSNDQQHGAIGSIIHGNRRLKQEVVSNPTSDAPFCCNGAICGQLCDERATEHLTARCHTRCCRSPRCGIDPPDLSRAELQKARSACLYVINQCDHTILVGVTAFASVHATLQPGEASCIAEMLVTAGSKYAENGGLVSIFYQDNVDKSQGNEWTGSKCVTLSTGRVCWVEVYPYHKSPGYQKVIIPGEEKLIWSATCT